MRRIWALLTAMLLCFPLAACGEELDQYVQARFRERKIVGGGVIIARDGEILYGYDYGYKNASKTQPTTLDTCFHAASVTKMVSAIGLMQLLEDYDISLETPVKDITGIPVVNPAFPEEDITIRQVLSHTSTLVQTNKLTPNWEEMKAENSYFTAEYGPGEGYAYSNMNGGLIGAMIEAISGKSVNTYMQRYIFGPLKINAAYHAALLPDKSDISAKLLKSGTNFRSAANELKTFDEYDDSCLPQEHTDITSGGLYISPNGLIRIVMLLENGGVLEGVRIITEDSVQLMMQDQSKIEGSSVTAESPYGLCMTKVEGLPGGTWYGHQGMWQGLTSNAYFQPDTGLCVVVFANGYNANRVDGVTTIARDFMEKAQEFLK